MSSENMKLKYYCKIKDGTHDTPKYVNNSKEAIPFVTSKDIKGGIIDFTEVKYISLEDHSKFYKRSNVENGDVLMPMIGTIGNPAIVDTNETFSIKNVALFKTSNDPDKARYLYYLLSNKVMKEQLELMKSGGVQSFVSLSILKNLNILVPENLTSIVKYLDQKTSEIDALIADKEKLITLLEEKRQAVITETVTKGLDPNVKMKDSGIEWIGEIPEHWETMKMKYLTEIIDGDRGNEYPNENDLVDDGVPFLSGDNLTNKGLVFKKTRFITYEKFSKLGRGKLIHEDIVVSVRGTIGKTGLFKSDKYTTGFVNAQMMIVRTNNKVSSSYLYDFTKTNSWNFSMSYHAYGTAQQQLSNKVLNELIIPLPPLEEQTIISNYLKTKNENLDIIVEDTKFQISKLKEYRESLIYESVTGKIDLRNYGEESELLVAERGEPYGN